MAADISTSPLLRLPDELLMIIFDLVVQHAQRDGPFTDTSYLVVSLDSRFSRKATDPFSAGNLYTPNRILASAEALKDLYLRVKLAPSVRNITPLRNVETMRLRLPVLVPEPSDTALIGELIQRFPSLTRLSLEIHIFGHEWAADLVRGSSWNTAKLRARFPGIPPLVDALSRTTRILRLVLVRFREPFVWTREEADQAHVCRQIGD
ncbi:hypothetical protein C6P46_003187 [Rhodotorula mucilaginosa]|uniref:Uncharacterized protein n=1 Tax=Rhodotorula mucilaginosa TaxID=5537 RepID=A0A9P6W3C0_RHOMI|nr:hypothetical protein C6P46_003187 [Rhodotorula mucilaginosa]